MSTALSEKDIADYHANGYVIPKYRLEPAFLKELQDALNTLIANNPGVRPEKLVSEIGRAHV